MAHLMLTMQLLNHANAYWIFLAPLQVRILYMRCIYIIMCSRVSPGVDVYLAPRICDSIFTSAVILDTKGLPSLAFQPRLHFSALRWVSWAPLENKRSKHKTNANASPRPQWATNRISSARPSFKVHLSFTSKKEVNLPVEWRAGAASRPAARLSRAQALQEWTFRKRRCQAFPPPRLQYCGVYSRTSPGKQICLVWQANNADWESEKLTSFPVV